MPSTTVLGPSAAGAAWVWASLRPVVLPATFATDSSSSVCRVPSSWRYENRYSPMLLVVMENFGR